MVYLVKLALTLFDGTYDYQHLSQQNTPPLYTSLIIQGGYSLLELNFCSCFSKDLPFSFNTWYRHDTLDGMIKDVNIIANLRR
jgi:hypothetical protein